MMRGKACTATGPPKPSLNRTRLIVYWLHLAARHHLPRPDENNASYWKHDKFRGVSRLSDAGIDFIDRVLYEKRKRRWEIWMPLVSALTGMIGASTGLAAILLR